MAATLGVFRRARAAQSLVGVVRPAFGLAVEVVASRALIGGLAISAVPRPFVGIGLSAIWAMVGIEPCGPDRAACAMGAAMAHPRRSLLACVTSRRTGTAACNAIAAPPTAPVIVMVFSAIAHRAKDLMDKVARPCISASALVCVIEIGLAGRPAPKVEGRHTVGAVLRPPTRIIIGPRSQTCMALNAAVQWSACAPPVIVSIVAAPSNPKTRRSQRPRPPANVSGPVGDTAAMSLVVMLG